MYRTIKGLLSTLKRYDAIVFSLNIKCVIYYCFWRIVFLSLINICHALVTVLIVEIDIVPVSALKVKRYPSPVFINLCMMDREIPIMTSP